MPPQVHLVSVFTSSRHPGDGGNLAPIVLDANCMTDTEMQEMARSHGHESSFVLPAPDGSEADRRLRFWVPEHEMEMCGHATVGTTWLLNKLGLIKNDSSTPELKFSTISGIVRARVLNTTDQETVVEISQPRGQVETVSDPAIQQEILSVLRVSSDQLDSRYPIQNSCTSRVKTMVSLKDAAILNGLRPDFSGIKGICEKLNSTGLYPYAVTSKSDASAVQVETRQFPKASGYPEDAATGIAAAALGYAVLENGIFEQANTRKMIVTQGVAMGFPSEIRVRIEEDSEKGCWIGGTARFSEVGNQG